MRESEKRAHDYLKSLAIGEVEYEPIKNSTPDFLVNGRIAVEVRRLNFHASLPDGSLEPVETEQFRLMKRMRNLLNEMEPDSWHETWFVTYSFKRPIPQWKVLKNQVSCFLRTFCPYEDRSLSVQLDESFQVTMIKASKRHARPFLLGGFTDRDTGGFLGPSLTKNIVFCIEEKSQKTAKVWNQYPEWWLVLVDQIGYGVRETIEIDHSWSKVIVLSPIDPLSNYVL